MRLSLVRYGGRIRGYVDIIFIAFATVRGKEYNQLLVVRNNLLKNFFSYYCNLWF